MCTSSGTANRFSVLSGNPQQVLKDHMHYVQGIAWDPIGQYFASISNDRTCRIYCNKPQNLKRKSEEQNIFTCQNVLVKAELVKQEELKQDEETSLKVKLLSILYVMQRLFPKSKPLIVRFSGFSS
jgi:WD40 repeat protein